ncbi:hypothetical protein DFJ58DRAFT_673505 [Suillus subalutaceus]|uniref:uncharacterized protein n=1 Tax=Suillus subalutaceus TaxID=48586 RepID=UPI001B869DE9|nr:uncharacterized protein DFJ58DRAFT_673505 [Suillus subalutaceus]KAG1816656.1 hypothetical protein DFJ58DRAFT_673505 [Suillus subalutaceus]
MDVFVLKSEFNPAWTLFNVHELGDTITSHWRSHLFMLYEQQREFWQSIDKPLGEWFRPLPTLVPQDWMSDFLTEQVFDVIKAGLCNRRFLVSRKQTATMFDLTNTWKKSLLSDTLRTFDDEIANILVDDDT